MLSPPVAAVLAGAVLSWPGRSPGDRLRRLIRPSGRRDVRLRLPRPEVSIGVAAVVALLVSGIGMAIAVVVGGVTVRALVRSQRGQSSRIASAEAMTDALHGLVAELRSGAHPVTAAESASRDAREPARAVLSAISATVRLGGDVTTTADRCAADNPSVAPVLTPFVRAWSLAQRHGLPLADVLDAVRADLTERVRFARRVRARMAGPRASGTVLAALPLVAVALGEAMGAHPLHVLMSGALGQALLAAGVALICAGLYWTSRLTSRAVL